MTKLIVSMMLAITLVSSGVVNASPATPSVAPISSPPSAYADYLQKLDSLTKATVAPPVQGLEWGTPRRDGGFRHRHCPQPARQSGGLGRRISNRRF